MFRLHEPPQQKLIGKAANHLSYHLVFIAGETFKQISQRSFLDEDFVPKQPARTLSTVKILSKRKLCLQSLLIPTRSSSIMLSHQRIFGHIIWKLTRTNHLNHVIAILRAPIQLRNGKLALKIFTHDLDSELTEISFRL